MFDSVEILKKFKLDRRINAGSLFAIKEVLKKSSWKIQEAGFLLKHWFVQDLVSYLSLKDWFDEDKFL